MLGSYKTLVGNRHHLLFLGGGDQPDDDDEVEGQKDTIFIQNLPKNITRDELYDVFSEVGHLKSDQRSGGPKIWIFKDRMTGEGNGHATVTYEHEKTAQKAIFKYNNQRIPSLGTVVKVQLTQRWPRRDFGGDRDFSGEHGRGGGYSRRGRDHKQL
ncbi:unnamed protein product [Didymodactylos carnosus]|uniref:RRM domain-containing protein n=1 Tax=Didymodactylos carnosus TaxID=1234261 RepID=A0A814L2Y3_9BILA|nr:unnamed protein product [Didymodactylos carnosus]CAF1505392.1 unnamed protein product [Didymodactylos carnosus]CAF3826494.1 unnamed protein product [Didymodactylos carnosus]CAF4293680.1 unnamed protein product [Didymodactylos carnosus]